MKYLLYSVVFLSFMVSGFGQTIEDESFYYIRTPDNISGNDSVPDVYSTDVSFERIIVARMKHRKDILEGLNELVRTENIKNAIILTGIGSVRDWHIHVVDNKTFPSKNTYIRKDIPADVTNMGGYVIDGRVHAHITLSDENTAIGGHLETGTHTFTFCVITIGILDDQASLKRFDDKSLR